jgi:hypothetical protein
LEPEPLPAPELVQGQPGLYSPLAPFPVLTPVLVGFSPRVLLSQELVLLASSLVLTLSVLQGLSKQALSSQESLLLAPYSPLELSLVRVSSSAP